MGTNKKKEKKKTPENKNDMDRKIKFLCHVLLLPLMPIQYSPKKKKTCKLPKVSHIVVKPFLKQHFFSTPPAFSRDVLYSKMALFISKCHGENLVLKNRNTCSKIISPRCVKNSKSLLIFTQFFALCVNVIHTRKRRLFSAYRIQFGFKERDLEWSSFGYSALALHSDRFCQISSIKLLNQ